MMKKDCLIMKETGKIIYDMEKDIEDTGVCLVINTMCIHKLYTVVHCDK